MGVIMQARVLRGGRGVQLAASVVVCSALWASSAQAFTEDDQKRLCTGDVFRLCSSEIPDRERIIVCMRHKRAQSSRLVPTFQSSCSIAAPTVTNFGKSWALANLLKSSTALSI